MSAYGGKKYSFFGKFGVLCFLVTFILRFALLPYHRRIMCKQLVLRIIMNTDMHIIPGEPFFQDICVDFIEY